MAKREKDVLESAQEAHGLDFEPKKPTDRPIESKSNTSSADDLFVEIDRSNDALFKIEKTIRIAVTGDVFITKLEKEIIDEPDFQRLRGVRQLGNVAHVYPTALHTRFDHSLGTLAMADKMVQAIRNNRASEEGERDIQPAQEIIARLYALLHDITHVPFGHTIEDELGILKRHDQNPERINRFLGPGSKIGTIIQNYIHKDGYSRFMRVYLWKEEEKDRKARMESGDWKPLKEWLEPREGDDDIFIHDLVSNTVCADLLDYVARDNYFCNLEVGLEYRFINFLYLGKPHGSRFRRVFVRLWKGRQHAPRRDTMTDLARLLEARYMIAERAYFHHAKIISGMMLGRALQEHLIAKYLKESDLYEHTDDTLLWALRRSDSRVASKLASALWNRQLYKVITTPYDDSAFAAVESGDVEHNAKDLAIQVLGPAESRRLIENEFAERIGAEPGDVLIYAPALDMNPKTAEMNVRWHGQDKKFKDIDDPIIKPRLQQIIDSHHMLWGIHLVASRAIAKDSKRRDLLRDAFETQFLCPRIEQHKRRLDHNEKLVDFALSNDGYPVPPLPYGEIKNRIKKTAEALETTSKDSRPFRDRIREAIETHVCKT